MERVTAYVTAVHRGRYELETEGKIFFGRLKTAEFLYHGGEALFPTVGDMVEADWQEQGDSVIQKVLPRKSVFMRLNSTQGQPDQAVAANFDYVFVVMSLNRDFHVTKLERYLTVAWQSGGIPVVILSKADLCADAGDFLAKAGKAAPGTDILCLSAKTGDGMEALEPFLGKGKSVVLLGSSGVGKSSLVNVLLGSDVMETGTIREYDSQGRHTTTHRQCFLLPDRIMLPGGREIGAGARIIDTPGMRMLHVSDFEQGAGNAFEDVETLAAQCRFRDCSHGKEPGCAVKAAIADGRLPVKKWNNYLSMRKEAEYAKKRAEIIAKKQSRRKRES